VRRVSIKILLCVKDKRVAGHPMAGAGGRYFPVECFFQSGGSRTSHIGLAFALIVSGVGDLVLAYPLNCLEHFIIW
jgi:hypothetical protein